MTATINVPAAVQGMGVSGDTYADLFAQERDEAAHTVSIWNSHHRGQGARRLVAVGGSALGSAHYDHRR